MTHPFVWWIACILIPTMCQGDPFPRLSAALGTVEFPPQRELSPCSGAQMTHLPVPPAACSPPAPLPLLLQRRRPGLSLRSPCPLIHPGTINAHIPLPQLRPALPHGHPSRCARGPSRCCTHIGAPPPSCLQPAVLLLRTPLRNGIAICPVAKPRTPGFSLCSPTPPQPTWLVVTLCHPPSPDLAVLFGSMPLTCFSPDCLSSPREAQLLRPVCPAHSCAR